MIKSERLQIGTGYYLLADDSELHDRIADGKNGDFERIRKGLSKIGSIKIGISRYNFYCLERMLRYAALVKGRNITELDSVKLPIFPVSELYARFIDYVKNLKGIALSLDIEFILHDSELGEILEKISQYAKENICQERELVRFLGIISEEAFIGPQTIVFDPYHRCNSNCMHCWVHTPSIKHSQEFLNRHFDLEIFKHIIDDASSMMVDGIILQGDGEPLMYDKFRDMLRYARSKGLGKQPERTFDVITGNLRRLMELRAEAKKSKPRLIISHVIHNMNYHELVEMALNDASIRPDAVRYYLIRLDVMNRFLQLSPEEIKSIKEMVPKISDILHKEKIEFVDNFEFQLGNYDEKTGAWSKDFFLKNGCTIGWYFNLIPAKYDMSFCCHLRTVGHVHKKSYKDIWFSKEYKRWRRQAKYLKHNINARFLNGQLLYDEHCDHCDNHQTLLNNIRKMKELDLHKYL